MDHILHVIATDPQAVTVGFLLGFLICLGTLALGTLVDRSSE